MALDEVTPEVRKYMNDEVTQVLHVLSAQRIRYSIWGSAATEYHGGDWLWKCQDYEIIIEDWFDGPVMRQSVDTITARCHPSWLYDHRFNEEAWATARGDRPPHRPIRRFKHNIPSSPSKLQPSFQSLDFGIILVASHSTHVVSTQPIDLVNATTPLTPARIYPNETDIPTDPVWIYPTLKNYVESQLLLWNYAGRNSALLDLADVVSARRLSIKWAEDVGLDVTKTRNVNSPDVPCQWEVWEELVRARLTQPDRRRASARFRARRASRERERGTGVVHEADGVEQEQTRGLSDVVVSAGLA